jgi:paired amphipathic helix protein Sin3a
VHQSSNVDVGSNNSRIDTPGVIERVSQLFAGHPNLIQGFNTFLPPGYRIECGLGDDPNSIRVTTPMGTTQSVLPGRPPSRSYLSSTGNLLPPPPPHHYAEPNNVAAWQAHHHQRGPPDHGYAHDNRLPPPTSFVHGGAAPMPESSAVGAPDPHRELPQVVAPLDHRTLPPILQSVQGLSRHPAPVAVSASEALALAPLTHGTSAQMLIDPGAEKRGPVEFNHAINYVNKIKNRFASQPDIYKQFLEILQTYQRESKPIGDVYTQVTRLFDAAPDLLEDFKQFLPESAAHANAIAAARAGEGQFPTSNTRTEPTYQVLAGHSHTHLTPRADQSRLPPMGNFAPTPSSSRDKRKRGEKAAPRGEQMALSDRASVVQAASASKVRDFHFHTSPVCTSQRDAPLT